MLVRGGISCNIKARSVLYIVLLSGPEEWTLITPYLSIVSLFRCLNDNISSSSTFFQLCMPLKKSDTINCNCLGFRRYRYGHILLHAVLSLIPWFRMHVDKQTRNSLTVHKIRSALCLNTKNIVSRKKVNGNEVSHQHPRTGKLAPKHSSSSSCHLFYLALKKT